MDIIKKGKGRNILFVCNICGCIFKAEYGEYKYRNFGGDIEFHCDCPECGIEAATLYENHRRVVDKSEIEAATFYEKS